MKAQDLKNSVLQLAIQGKLVEQNHNDEPASMLLDKIRIDKEQLIKEKKIKKEKPLPEIGEEEKPFEIPDTWEWVRLGDCCIQFFSGKTPKYSVVANENFVLGQKNNQLYGIDMTGVKYCTDEFINNYPANMFIRENDILLNTLGTGTVGRVGIVSSLDGKYITDGHLFVMRTISKVLSQYLFFVLSSMRVFIEKDSVGTTNQMFLKKTNVQNYIIPVPPLEEQRRIVAKIEEVLEKIEEYDKAEKELTQLEKVFPQDMKKSILQYAIQAKLVEQNTDDEPAYVLLDKIRAEKEQLIKEKKIKKEKPLPEISEEEKPFDIPESWEWIRIGELAVLENGDRSKRYPKEIDCVSNGIPFFGAKDIGNEYMEFDNVRFITKEKYNELGSGKLQDGDIVCLLRGSVGKIAIFKSNSKYDTGFICAQMIIVRLINKDTVPFIINAMKSPIFKKVLESKVTGTAVRQLPAIELSKMVIPLPPLEEQKRIVESAEKFSNYLDKLQNRIDNQKFINKIVEAKSIEVTESRELINN